MPYHHHHRNALDPRSPLGAYILFNLIAGDQNARRGRGGGGGGGIPGCGCLILTAVAVALCLLVVAGSR